MAEVNFGYDSLGGGWPAVTTLEEDEYPTHYHRRHSTNPAGGALAESDVQAVPTGASSSLPAPAAASFHAALFRGQRDFLDNQRVSPTRSCSCRTCETQQRLELHDPYIHMGHQGRNLVDLLALIAAAKDPADEVTVNLFTVLDQDPEYQTKQLHMLNDIVQGAAQQGIKVNVAKDPGGHDRWIRTDTGWRINLGRGHDIFQKSDGGWFDFDTSRHEFRQVRAFGVTYIREEG